MYIDSILQLQSMLIMFSLLSVFRAQIWKGMEDQQAVMNEALPLKYGVSLQRLFADVNGTLMTVVRW